MTTNAPESNKQLKFIDGLRAFAILLVLIHHAYSDVLPKLAFGNVGVVVFFAISGFLVLGNYTTPNATKPWGFYVNRVLRIVPAYCLTIFVCYSILPTQGALSPIFLAMYAVNWPMTFFDAWPPGALSPLWSIAVEMQFYLIAPFLIMYRTAGVLLVLILSVLFITFELFTNIKIGNGGLYYSTFLYLPVFIAGGGAATYMQTNSTWIQVTPQNMTRLGVLGLLILVLIWRPFPPYGISSYIAPYAMPIIAFLLLAGLGMGGVFKILESKILSYVAKMSFSYYLVHLIILDFLAKYLPGGIGNPYVRTAVFWPSLLILGHLLHKYVELPVLRIRKNELLARPINARVIALIFLILPIVMGGVMVLIVNSKNSA